MDPQILSEYFKKCYIAVDGLWFMMLEKTDSFDKALEVDGRVWEILPKIQARKIKELLFPGGIELLDLLLELMQFYPQALIRLGKILGSIYQV